jgi:hypothetical protein
MNIDDLTLGQIKQLKSLFNENASTANNDGLNSLVGKKVIVRTYSCGVHYGKLIEKSGSEVILEDSRMLYYWKTTDGGISLGEIANTGLHKNSKACAPVKNQWLDAIGIIPCTDEAIKNIEAKNVYKA